MSKKNNQENVVLTKVSGEAVGVLLVAVGLFAFFLSARWLIDVFKWPAPSWLVDFGGLGGSFVLSIFAPFFGGGILVVPIVFLMFGWAKLLGREFNFGAKSTTLFIVLMMLFSLDVGVLTKMYASVDMHASLSGSFGRHGSARFIEMLGDVGSLVMLLPCTLAVFIILTKLSLLSAATHVATGVGVFGGAFKGGAVVFARLLKKLKPRPKKASASRKKVSRAEPVFKAESIKPQKKAEQPSQEVIDVVDSGDDDCELVLSEAQKRYVCPSIELLDENKDKSGIKSDEWLQERGQLLEAKLKDFGVHGEVKKIVPGPVVTMFEFLPDAGVKINKVANLSDDLAMALSALSIRIVAPIPGRGVVGIEIPNDDRCMVGLREVVAESDFLTGQHKLPIALGRDIFGEPVVGDLVKMPHLLVAGSTGTGKSVCVNSMIVSLLLKYSPDDLKMILIDPKMLELSVYDEIPHLLHPVVTEPKKAVLALGWAVREMQRRYKLLAETGVRGIDGYNALVREGRAPEADGIDSSEHVFLPRVVIVVDEMADLVMVAGKEIEELVARLAQMARAAGIHLVLATQRPSVDVITGLIKANLPSRISFKVFSKMDSRTVLDSGGAESLLGAGDMLFLSPGTSTPRRIHGSFVSDSEVEKISTFVKGQAKPEYDETIIEPEQSVGGEIEDDDYDEKYDEAVAYVTEHGQASISLLQRRFKIGYNRAARIVEKMERDGVVGPSDGTSRPREVLVNRL